MEELLRRERFSIFICFSLRPKWTIRYLVFRPFQRSDAELQDKSDDGNDNDDNHDATNSNEVHNNSNNDDATTLISIM